MIVLYSLLIKPQVPGIHVWAGLPTQSRMSLVSDKVLLEKNDRGAYKILQGLCVVPLDFFFTWNKYDYHFMRSPNQLFGKTHILKN